ncbi:acyl-CoA carboxylase epsilon subunit [Streptomyces sp. NPDC093261]|uniref:acyl-CoA carboxylase epsilon subunit n=1 Tax=Streptomyces sp. NPDC093261 TaxID=3366037 RepID=UPI0037F7E841
MSNDTVLRIERGNADPEELAAVTALLLARAAARPISGPPGPPPTAAAAWRRPDRERAYRPPHSWKGAGAGG